MQYDKLKKEQNEKLNAIIGVTFSKDKFIDEEVLQTIGQISKDSGLEIAILINRKGKVENIFVGDKKSADFTLDVKSNLLCGIRLIHTHPFSSSELSDMDISALKNNKLDCVAAISIDEKGINNATIGFINGEGIDKIKIDNANYINKYGIMDKIIEYDKMYREWVGKLYSNKEEDVKALLVVVDLNKSIFDMEETIEELSSLCRTININVLGWTSQKRQSPHSRYFIGEGKVAEIREQIQLNNINLVVFENELSGGKQSNLSQVLNVKVIDRSMLILDIFASRARTNEGKLQVELAQLKYSLPRLSYLSQSSGKYGGGVGMRGPGETKLEFNKRVVEKNIVRKTEELNKLKKHRELNRKNRIKNKKPMISIVGYTNSGKSSLLNLLAKENLYAKNELFATLDTTTRNVWLGKGKEVLFTDTVGFINNLPHEFIEAFSSTLEECVYSDILLHVVDISNKNYENQQKVVLDVLKKLGANSPMITVYNKIDKLEKNYNKQDIDKLGIYISVKDNMGIEKLKKEILKYI